MMRHQRRTSCLRIIGGGLRGRKITFPALVGGLRPTADRTRETLFNWLSNDIQGARCLDLFAGSGALGLEALSRGADNVCFVDASRLAIKYLQDNVKLFGADNSHVVLSTAQAWLQRFDLSRDTPFDIIFIDPPFRQQYVSNCVAMIDKKRLLNSKAWVYLEMGKEESRPLLPKHWQLYREKQAGQVCYRLFQCVGSC